MKFQKALVCQMMMVEWELIWRVPSIVQGPYYGQLKRGHPVIWLRQSYIPVDRRQPAILDRRTLCHVGQLHRVALQLFTVENGFKVVVFLSQSTADSLQGNITDTSFCIKTPKINFKNSTYIPLISRTLTPVRLLQDDRFVERMYSCKATLETPIQAT